MSLDNPLTLHCIMIRWHKFPGCVQHRYVCVSIVCMYSNLHYYILTILQYHYYTSITCYVHHSMQSYFSEVRLWQYFKLSAIILAPVDPSLPYSGPNGIPEKLKIKSCITKVLCTYIYHTTDIKISYMFEVAYQRSAKWHDCKMSGVITNMHNTSSVMIVGNISTLENYVNFHM